MNQLQVLIVGAGNIAGRFDRGRQKSDLPLTHAGAFSRDGRFKIKACIEPDVVKRKEFMEMWHIEYAFATFAEFLKSNIDVDLVSICSPTHSHKDDVELAIKASPKLIFCEKPVSTSSMVTKELVDRCRQKNIMFAVNYSRRWDPDIIELRQIIKNQMYGELRSIQGTYNKGLLNNGSHMLDLLYFLLGDIAIKYIGKRTQDYFDDDPTIPFWLESCAIPVQISIANAQDYAMFELQFIFAKQVVSMRDGGLYWHSRKVIDSPQFHGYKVLSTDDRKQGRYTSVMQNAVDNIYAAIMNDEVLQSQGDNALYVQELCEEVLNGAQ